MHSMVLNGDGDMNEVIRCKITSNASYDPRSAEIIARNCQLDTVISVISALNSCLTRIIFYQGTIGNIHYSSRNGYIKRFSYNCTQFSRKGLNRVSKHRPGEREHSISSSVPSSVNIQLYVESVVNCIIHICILASSIGTNT